MMHKDKSTTGCFRSAYLELERNPFVNTNMLGWGTGSRERVCVCETKRVVVRRIRGTDVRAGEFHFDELKSGAYTRIVNGLGNFSSASKACSCKG